MIPRLLTINYVIVQSCHGIFPFKRDETMGLTTIWNIKQILAYCSGLLYLQVNTLPQHQWWLLQYLPYDWRPETQIDPWYPSIFDEAFLAGLFSITFLKREMKFLLIFTFLAAIDFAGTAVVLDKQLRPRQEGNPVDNGPQEDPYGECKDCVCENGMNCHSGDKCQWYSVCINVFQPNSPTLRWSE